jgi:HPt (histidine-containing phosphotransfer) domain-containing protein
VEVFNRPLALERLGGDDGRLNDLLHAFQQSVPSMVQDLEAAQASKNAERLESHATELRESVHRIGAEGMEDLAAQMIEAARASDFAKAETLLTHMGMELDWLLRILDESRCSGNL